MTVRAWLRDDPDCAVGGDPATARVVVALDGDECLPWTQPVVFPETPDGEQPLIPDGQQRPVQVSHRTRMGYDEDGVPLFDWATIVEGPAIVSQMRREFDAVAGLTHVEGTVTVEYDGPVQVFETAAVKFLDDQSLWRVVAVSQPFGRVMLSVRRIDQQVEGIPAEPPVSYEYVVQDDGTRLYSGLGLPPDVILGARPGDWYLDLETSIMYRLEE